VSENRVLRRIFRSKRDEVTEKRRKLHNEELHNLYSFPNIIRQIKSRRMRWVGACGMHGRGQKSVQGFGGKVLKERDHLEDKGTDGRMGPEWILWIITGGVEWILLAQDRNWWRALVSTVMNHWVLAPWS
jgi:hypothetical protein